MNSQTKEILANPEVNEDLILAKLAVLSRPAGAWAVAKARDERAHHNDGEAIRMRRDAMAEIDGLLDRYNQEVVGL